MFSYYGSKSKTVQHYPKPAYGTIVEPFAGSARYACKYGLNRDVILCDQYEVIVRIWKWIQQATKADIRKLPELKLGERVSNCKELCDEERWLLGFSVNMGTPKPRDMVTGRAVPSTKRTKTSLLRIVGRISHWQIVHGSYEDLRNREATWFIDPPYQEGGEFYACGSSNIDYQHLGKWCLSRRGQIIVCEAGEALWLPFRRMRVSFKSSRQTSHNELIYHRCNKPIGFGFNTRSDLGTLS